MGTSNLRGAVPVGDSNPCFRALSAARFQISQLGHGTRRSPARHGNSGRVSRLLEAASAETRAAQPGSCAFLPRSTARWPAQDGQFGHRAGILPEETNRSPQGAERRGRRSLAVVAAASHPRNQRPVVESDDEVEPHRTAPRFPSTTRIRSDARVPTSMQSLRTTRPASVSSSGSRTVCRYTSAEEIAHPHEEQA
jgi:hypothetical protein